MATNTLSPTRPRVAVGNTTGAPLGENVAAFSSPPRPSTPSSSRLPEGRRSPRKRTRRSGDIVVPSGGYEGDAESDDDDLKPPTPKRRHLMSAPSSDDILPTLVSSHSNEEEEKLADVHVVEEEIPSNPSENGVLTQTEGPADPQSPGPESHVRDFGTDEPEDEWERLEREFPMSKEEREQYELEEEELWRSDEGSAEENSVSVEGGLGDDAAQGEEEEEGEQPEALEDAGAGEQGPGEESVRGEDGLGSGAVHGEGEEGDQPEPDHVSNQEGGEVVGEPSSETREASNEADEQEEVVPLGQGSEDGDGAVEEGPVAQEFTPDEPPSDDDGLGTLGWNPGLHNLPGQGGDSDKENEKEGESFLRRILRTTGRRHRTEPPPPILRGRGWNTRRR